MDIRTFIATNWHIIISFICILFFAIVNLKSIKKRWLGPVETDVSNEYLEIKKVKGKAKAKRQEKMFAKNVVTAEKVKSHSDSTKGLWINLTSDDNIEAQKLTFGKYFETLKEYISKAQTSIIILDLIDHLETMKISEYKPHELEKNKILQDCYIKYFNYIEDFLIKNNKVTYIRILMLPAFSNTYRELFGTKSIPVVEENLRILLYEPKKKHIERMFEAVNQGKISRNNFKLFYLENPIRALSEVVIDSNFWLHEIDIHNKKGVSMPDCLFINEGTNDVSMKYLIEKEKELIEKIISKKSAKTLDFETFKMITSTVRITH